MRKLNKIVLILCIVAFMITLATGCSKQNISRASKQGSNNETSDGTKEADSKNNSKTYDPKTTVVLQVGDTKIYLNEMLYNVGITELQWKTYETKEGKGFWDMEYADGLSVRDYLKKDIMENAIRTEILYSMAKKAGEKLTDEENSLCEDDTVQLMRYFTNEQTDIMGIMEKNLLNIQKKLTLCSNYYNKYIDKYEVNEDEVRANLKKEDYKQYDIQYIFASTKIVEDGKEVEISKKNKNKLYKTLSSLKKDAADVSDLRDLSNEENQFQVKNASFVEGDGTFSEEQDIENAAVKMKAGEISDIIETSKGYYLIKLLDNTSDESYEEAVQNAVEDKKYEAFEKEYNEFKKNYDIDINDSVWDDIVIGNTTINYDTE